MTGFSKSSKIRDKGDHLEADFTTVFKKYFTGS